ncbi:MAG: TetR/AcrR family transcriptional regulator [Alkalilacustris sp.]
MSHPPEGGVPAPPDKTRRATDTRARLLRAAEALARRDGPGHLSLDAVAAEAGVSKGGLLYHFPSKTRLLEALVEEHLQRMEAVLAAAEARPDARPGGLLGAYLAHAARDCAAGTPPSPAFLAALVDHPDLLAPVGGRQRAMLDRICADAPDPELATLAFVAVHGLRAMRLLGTAMLDEGEEADLMAMLRARLADGPDGAGDGDGDGG